MSWIDSGAGGADVKIRRSYYLRGLSADTGDQTYRINDQLPNNMVFRVSAQAALSGTITNTVVSTQLIELRIYNAFTNERVYDSSQQSSFLVMGWFIPVNGSGANATGAGSYLWTPAPPVESRSMGTGRWRIQFYDISTDATISSAQFAAFAIGVDVRSGGVPSYPN